MPLPADEQRFLEAVKAPAHKECVARANEFLALTGMSVTDFSEGLKGEYGRGSRVALMWWLRGDYGRAGLNHCTTRFMDARVWDFVERNWPKPPVCEPPEDILETAGFVVIRSCFEQALEEGVNSLIYGPPSSEKSEVLRFLVGRRRAAGHDDAAYIYCGQGLRSPLPFARALAVALGVFVARAHQTQQFVDAILRSLASRKQQPAVVLDEAQHLLLPTFEVVREIHEITARRNRGCGVGFIFAGSHNLFRDFMHPARRPRVEQLLSRIPLRKQLEGMKADEVLRLAARAFGNGKPAKFTAEQERRLLERCTVEDTYATDANAGPLRDGKGRLLVRTYYSARRLLEYIRQQKRARVSRVLAEEVA